MDELRIVIKAVTSEAEKSLKQVKKALGDLDSSTKKTSGAFSKMAKATAVAGAAVVGALAGVGIAMKKLEQSTRDYRNEHAKLITAFKASGASAAIAEKTYGGLFRFLGESDTAVEAANHLARLTNSEQSLAEWTKICQGVYATFGDSLPIEGLTEAANETARVGKVTGTMADALNWMGVSEEAFNAQLAQCNTLTEREALLRSTLNGLYGQAAEEFEKNNKAILDLNESQARLDAALATLGNIVTPVITAFNNLAATLLEVLSPAIQFVGNVLSFLISKLATAIGYIRSFFGISSKSKDVSVGMGGVAAGANKAAGGFDKATKAAQKFKNTTAGFDELKKVGAEPTAAGGGGGGGGGAGYADGIAGGAVPAPDTTEFDNTISRMSAVIDTLKTAFEPAITAWQAGFATLALSWDEAKIHFTNGLVEIGTGFSNVGSYVVTTFIPDIINSFSVNLAPMLSEIGGAILIEGSLFFETLGKTWNSTLTNILIPALNIAKKQATDVFDSIGKAWKKHGGEFVEQFHKVGDNLRKGWDQFYNGLILPVWNIIQKYVKEIWDEHLKPLVDTIIDAGMEIGTCLMELYNEVIAPIALWVQQTIQPIIVGVADVIGRVVSTAVGVIADVLRGVMEVLKGVIQFVTGVFTGNWRQAWEGVKNIFKGVFDSLVGVIKVPLNLIIGAINGLIRGIVSGVNTAIRAINKLHFTVPDWVPGIGGSRFGFNIGLLSAPQIPRLAEGGIVTSATLLEAGEAGNEAILPLENNTEWMDKLADKLAERHPTKIVLNVDGKELGWTAIDNINSITKQTGELQLAIC